MSVVRRTVHCSIVEISTGSEKTTQPYKQVYGEIESKMVL